MVHVAVYFSTLDSEVEVDNGLRFDSQSILIVLAFAISFHFSDKKQPELGTPQIDLIST